MSYERCRTCLGKGVVKWAGALYGLTCGDCDGTGNANAARRQKGDAMAKPAKPMPKGKPAPKGKPGGKPKPC